MQNGFIFIRRLASDRHGSTVASLQITRTFLPRLYIQLRLLPHRQTTCTTLCYTPKIKTWPLDPRETKFRGLDFEKNLDIVYIHVRLPMIFRRRGKGKLATEKEPVHVVPEKRSLKRNESISSTVQLAAYFSLAKSQNLPAIRDRSCELKDGLTSVFLTVGSLACRVGRVGTVSHCFSLARRCRRSFLRVYSAVVLFSASSYFMYSTPSSGTTATSAVQNRMRQPYLRQSSSSAPSLGPKRMVASWVSPPQCSSSQGAGSHAVFQEGETDRLSRLPDRCFTLFAIRHVFASA